MQPISPDNDPAAHPAGRGRTSRNPSENWMVPSKPVLVITQTGCTVIPPSKLTGEAVGWKAFGLACLPREWTLPFFVIEASCLGDLRDEEQLAEWIRQAIDTEQIRADRQVMVRSSGTAETMSHRGRLHSRVCNIFEIVSTIRALPAERREGDVHWIVQEAIASRVLGHLSNERHVSRERRDWVVQLERRGGLGEVTTRIAVRSWRDGIVQSQRKLQCNSETEITLCLKRVAMWASLFSRANPLRVGVGRKRGERCSIRSGGEPFWRKAT